MIQTKPADVNHRKKPRRHFYLIMWLMVLIPAAILIYLFAGPIREGSGRLFFQYAVKYLPRSLRKAVFNQLAAEVSGIYDTVPEPEVGRILQRNVIKMNGRAEIISNNAGMRDRRNYIPKRDNVYRIVCLGDSFVFGEGGKEEDRLGNQLEEMLGRLDITGEGKPIEVYSLGIPSWSTINEARYLTSRLSSYDPDLIIIIMASNDLGDSHGVTGSGTLTMTFSPEQRKEGSGIFPVYAPYIFGFLKTNFLIYDLGPECRARWKKAFDALKRMEELQLSRHKKMMILVLDHPYFVPVVAFYHDQYHLQVPLLISNYLMEKDAILPHDPHPNRRGHRILANHLLHLLARLGWLKINAEDLPPHHPDLNLQTEHPIKKEEIVELRRELAERFLPEGINFQRLREDDLEAILGGVLPAKFPPYALESAPFGTVKSGLLLKRRPGASRVIIEIETPPFPELYPFKLDMYLQGCLKSTLSLPTITDAGRHILAGEIPPLSDEEPAIEVLFRANSYWSEIDDARMKSYRLLSIRQE